MNEENLKHAPEGEEYEREDMNPRVVVISLISLAVVIIAIYLLVNGLYDRMGAYQKNNQPPQNPLVKAEDKDTRVVTDADIKRFPEPRLEENERIEINNFRLGEEQKLSTYGWVDEKAGIVRIPIARAMELTVQHGLPTLPRTGTVPPSAVNTARNAAVKSDTSQKERK